MKLTRPRGILFDWDNTLVNTWPTIHEALNVLMREKGREEWTLDQTKANVKQSMRDSFPVMFGDEWQEAAKIYQTAYRAIHLTNLEALEYAEEILKALKPTDIFIAAVSNKKGDNLRKEISHLGWDHYFDAIVGAGDATADKPDPAPVHLALKETDITPEQCWFVGDTTIDLECAQNVGCVPVLYGDVPTDGNAYDGFPIAHHSRDHHGFMEVIEHILQADAA